MNAIAPLAIPAYCVKVVSGKDKGTIYKLLSGTVSIGRHQDCDIQLAHDKKISRKHAIINITNTGVEIVNVSGKNKIFVNGKACNSGQLTPNTKIKIGDTLLEFSMEGAQEPAPLQAIPSSSNGEATKIISRPQKNKSGSGKKKFRFYLIVATIALLFIYLLSSGTKKNEPEQGITTTEDYKDNIDISKKIIESLQKEKRSKGKNTHQFKEAQANYIKGFRDFKKGQYERAVESFQACLSLYPQHTLCTRYLKESKNHFGRLIKEYTNLGTQYLEQGQFEACKSAFRNVMVMIKDPNDIRYKQALLNYKVCYTKLEGRL